jgi:hypothetical protein
MSKIKLLGWILLVGVIGAGIYQTCCAIQPVELKTQDVETLAEAEFTKYIKSMGLSANQFKREDIRFDDTVGAWDIVYRSLPGEKERMVAILVGKYGGVEVHTLGP